MNSASDLKRTARFALQGNWLVAIITGVFASLFGATFTMEESVYISPSKLETINDRILYTLFDEPPIYASITLAALSQLFLLFFVLKVILSGSLRLGYVSYNLNLIDDREPCFSDLLCQVHRLFCGFAMNLVTNLFLALWSMLFVIPGIIKYYAYAMTPYLLAEDPSLSTLQAITMSRQLMHGNKWRLFCLEFSFIGWYLIPLAIAFIPPFFLPSDSIASVIWMGSLLASLLLVNLVITPYTEAARAAFYRDIT